MISIGTITSILLGIFIILSLIEKGELGCSGILLVTIMILFLLAAGFIWLLTQISY